MARVIQLVFAMIIFVLAIAFHIRNDQPVTLHYYIGSADIPHLSWVMAGALVFGILLGFLAMLSSVIRLKREVRRLSKKHELATKEILNLRAIPIKDGP